MQTSTPRTRARAVAMLVLAAGLLSAGCEPKKSAATGEMAAKVNNDQISVAQVNHVLQQQRGLKPEQTEAASKQILQRLIDQDLAVQKALEQKLDLDPRVALQLEAARKEVLARAFVEKAGEPAAKPSAEDVAKYYEANPALFKERRIYSLQEIAIEASPEQVAQLRAKLAGVKNIGELVEYLKANDFRFSGNQAVRAAEQLPLNSLGMISAMRDGQAVLTPTPNGGLIVALLGSRSQPVDLEKATPAIEQFLLNARRRELVANDLKALRAAARIEYAQKFADAAASAGSAPTLGSTEASEAASGALK